jgi:uncharacterized membrane protein YphA (DoxX/SURF4 family)
MGSFFSKKIQNDFARYGLPWLRIPTGILQILASFALLMGFYFPWLLFIASAFLSLMMLVALVVRWKTRDPWVLCLPALFYFLLNLFIFAQVTRL